jgi:hypothetical protein
MSSLHKKRLHVTTGNSNKQLVAQSHVLTRRYKDMKEQTERIITSKEGEGKCHFTCGWRRGSVRDGPFFQEHFYNVVMQMWTLGRIQVMSSIFRSLVKIFLFYDIKLLVARSSVVG